MNGNGQYMQMQPMMQPPMQQNYQQVQVAKNAADFVGKSSYANLTKHRLILKFVRHDNVRLDVDGHGDGIGPENMTAPLTFENCSISNLHLYHPNKRCSQCSQIGPNQINGQLPTHPRWASLIGRHKICLTSMPVLGLLSNSSNRCTSHSRHSNRCTSHNRHSNRCTSHSCYKQGGPLCPARTMRGRMSCPIQCILLWFVCTSLYLWCTCLSL